MWGVVGCDRPHMGVVAHVLLVQVCYLTIISWVLGVMLR